MESTILFTILLLVLLTIYYQFWFKPQRIIKYYAKQLKARGYKILQCPYNPFQHDLIQTINRGVRQGDAMKIFKFQRGLYDVIVTNSMNRPKLQFNHPDFIKDFYSVDKHYEYPKEQKVVSLITRSSGRSQLSSSQGPQWKRKRTIFNKIFNFDFIKSQSYKISHLTTKAIKEQERLGKKINDIVSYNIFEMATRIFSQVMMEIFLGGGSKQEVVDGQPAGLYLSRLIQDSSKQILRPLNYILGIKFLNLGITQEQRQMKSRLNTYKKWALQFVTKRIQEIKQNWQINKHKSIPADIIQGLIMGNLKAKAEKSDQQTISSPQQIVDDFTSFFIAGIQTTATYTQMMIYYLAIYPRIEKKVRDQIDLYMKDDDYSYENLKKFTYIEMLQKETTRYFGPGTQLFPRIALHDNYLNGLPVKKGTQVLIMHMGNHYSQKYFNNPKQFRPQRWQSECNDIPPFVTGGFSAGARSCIGKHLAMLDSKIALIKFLKRYKKVVLPKNQFKIAFTFSVYPEQFEAIMTINQNERLV